ncbi:MAG: RNA polymerase sigma-54 factor, partial [Anaerovoracaceae bacterium]
GPGEAEERKPKDEGKQETKEDHLSEYIKERGYDDISYRQGEYSKDDKENSYEQYVSSDISLQEHLMFQLQFVSNKKACRRIGRYIIESLDENGYMTSTVEEVATAIGTCEENVEKVIALIQTFDPVGVGAQNLAQCLMIQLDNMGELTDDYKQILENHLEDLAANRLNLIAKKLGLTVEEIQEMTDVIKGLEPRPGRQFAS